MNTFTYLGLEFNKNGRYISAMKNNLSKAKRAAFSITKKAKSLNLSVSCQIHMINTIVKPILLYGCEIFCYENVKMLESFYVQCLKRILCVKNTTPSFMVYAETGCYPIYMDAMKRALCFYIKTQSATNSNLSKMLLSALHKKHSYNLINSNYLSYINSSLIKIGFPVLFNNTNPVTTCSVKQMCTYIKKSTTDSYLHSWHIKMNNSSKAIFYREIKEIYEFEPYLDILQKSKRITLTKFRLSNHYLPVETGSWQNIPREFRTCPICPTKIGNEFHYLFECPSTLSQRKITIPNYFLNNPNIFKMKKLFKVTDKNNLIELTSLIFNILKLF